MEQTSAATLRQREAKPTIARQTTLCSDVLVTGVAMHSGADSRVVLRPASAGSGITFITGAGRIPARAEFVVNTRRCTCLGSREATVDTVEHLLSALVGLGVDNSDIEVDGPELPILDGSAVGWVEAILKAGIEELPDAARFIDLSEPIALQSGSSWLIAKRAPQMSVTCATHFDHPLLGTQVEVFQGGPEDYVREIAPARTFGFIEEVEALFAAGLALGGSLDNALVIYPDRFSSDERLPQECVRHKVLDLIGDLALVGGRLCADITAIRPSHDSNTKFAAKLSAGLYDLPNGSLRQGEATC